MKREELKKLIEILNEHKSSKSDNLINETLKTGILVQKAYNRITEVKKERRLNEEVKKEKYELNLIVVRLNNEHDTAKNLFNKITSENQKSYVLIFHNYGIIHGFKNYQRLKLINLPTEENEIIELILEKLKLLKKIRSKKQ